MRSAGLSTLALAIVVVEGQTACDVLTDSCPYAVEGVCDALENGVCPAGSDCFDCDECQVNNLDCEACVQNGCYWCPLDALCISQPPPEQYWAAIASIDGAKQSSCTAPSDWATTCQADPNNVFTDPLYTAQRWAYRLLNVEEVWRAGITGKGVMIRVNDPDGVAVDHPEFADRFHEEASCDVYLPVNLTANTHGTAVASLAVAASNNGECAVGIAPGASLSVCLGPTEFSDESATVLFSNGLTTTHVSINSWGFDACLRIGEESDGDDDKEGGDRRFLQQADCPFVEVDAEVNPCTACGGLTDEACEEYIVEFCSLYFEEEYSGCAEFLDLFVSCGYNVLSDLGQTALTRGVREGRDGKGIIYVFAAGNERDIYEDVNMEGWLNTRFTITVGAVDWKGKHASYSTGGAALFISGPGGDFDSLAKNVAARPGGGCMDATVGTSFAAPSVAGAIALLLEVNPNLGWRDVQGILAATAQKVDDEDSSWTTNGSGLHHSNLYGFGVMDTYAAVEAAKSWVNFGPEKQMLAGSGPINLAIADDASDPVSSSITINETEAFSIESVVVYLQLVHESRGDLEVVLTSPHGTQSVLHPALRPENQQLVGEERWKLMTVRNFGESPTGEWQLTLTDKRPGNLGDCADLAFMLVVELADGSSGSVDCTSLESSSLCVDGTVFEEQINTAQDKDTGKTGKESCCACGGGIPPSDVNALISWRIVIYGHGDAGSHIDVENAAETSDIPSNNGNQDVHSGGANFGVTWLGGACSLAALNFVL